MDFLGWMFTSWLVVLYFFLLFTVCLLTFQKGHILLGILGIFLPILWLIGAILPARPGSRYQMEEMARYAH
jgi:apolipoprotein N-acyltransferase